jgi:quinol monooxygenase YgiN
MAGPAGASEGWTVYTIIDRRRVDQARLDETTRLAEVEFFPKVQAADGFAGFYLVADGDLFTAIFVWEDQAKADAFDATYRDWCKKLEELGHVPESDNRGEIVIQLEPQK